MSEHIKSLVREKYSQIAHQDKATNETTCCGVGPTGGTYNIMSDSYSHLPGYNADADLGLGCGLPTEFARIQPGHTVLDLGSGAGNDCFVARAEAGPTGKVIGVDFTPAMIRRARENAEKLGYNNVEFRSGDIEELPVSDASVDVVVSNCVLNLVPDKAKVFSEIYRVLRPGGHFSISDVVLLGELPDALRNAAEMYAGCVSGAIQMEDYLALARAAGFSDLTIQKQKPILIPDNILLEYLSADELREFVASGTGIFSITLYAEKPGKPSGKVKINLADLPLAKCGPGCCC
ncbi:MAG TPA: arsenite methyltransferase [Saprospiraceae bacterium]|nr:arsenite methyltransferase [Saprospiraceae bacterium]HNG89734.1 arsenite methyltransferase [Saprospiraceae bacterium]